MKALLVLALFAVATLLIPHNAYSSTKSDLLSKIGTQVPQAIEDEIDKQVQGNWSNIDKMIFSLNTNTSAIDDLAYSLYGNDTFVFVATNGSLVNGTHLPPPPPPPVEVCGDNIDNDGDGLADEDCPVLPPPDQNDIPDQPEKTVNNTATLRVCSFGDVDNNNGLVTQVNLMSDYECNIVIVDGDYCYSSCQGVSDKLKSKGYTKVNTAIALGNHDDKAFTKSFNGLSKLYGTMVFSDAETMPSINANLAVFLLDGNTGLGCSEAQFPFMKDQIESNDAKYSFVSVHQPFVIGKGGQHGANGQFACWDPLFRANGIDAVLQAHEHNYQRYDINGLEYFVIGTGTHDTGSSMYKMGDKKFQDFSCLKCFTGTNGFVVFDLSIDDPHIHNVIGWFLDNSGNVKDKFSLGDA